MRISIGEKLFFFKYNQFIDDNFDINTRYTFKKKKKELYRYHDIHY